MALKNNYSSVLDCFARGESTWVDKVCMTGAEGGEVFLSLSLLLYPFRCLPCIATIFITR